MPVQNDAYEFSLRLIDIGSSNVGYVAVAIGVTFAYHAPTIDRATRYGSIDFKNQAQRRVSLKTCSPQGLQIQKFFIP